MAKTTNWKFYVTPDFVASQRNNAFKTGTQVKNFAVKNSVSCGWIKTPGSSTRHFLIEVNSFQKAYSTVAKHSFSKSAGSSKKTGTRSHGKTTGKTTRRKSNFSSNSWNKTGNSNRQRGWSKSSRRAA